MGETALLLVGETQSDQNLYYKTGFLAGDPFFYVEKDGAGTLVVNSMEEGRARKQSRVGDVRTFEEFGLRELRESEPSGTVALARVVAYALKSLSISGVVSDLNLAALYADVLRSESIEVRIDPRLLVGERRHKSPDEILAIETAQRANERAVAIAIETIAGADSLHSSLHVSGIPLTSERLRFEVESALLRDGMENPATPIIAGGAQAADPHMDGSGVLREGEAIVLDVFPRSRETRYWADMTRTVVKGRPSDLLREMYDAVLGAQETALGMIAPGVDGKDVHGAVTEFFKQAGFDQDGRPGYPHGTGHGVGLDIHEEPVLSVRSDVLEVGDVITVEPGLYHPDVGGIRIEDMVLVTETGCRNLTDFPKRFSV